MDELDQQMIITERKQIFARSKIIDQRDRNRSGLKIKFSEQWDKLRPENFKVGKTLTTFRAYHEGRKPDKWDYYQRNIGCLFAVVLNGKKLGIARLDKMVLGESRSLTLSFIKKDTYAHYERVDFEALIKRFYRKSNVRGIGLWFTIEEVE